MRRALWTCSRAVQLPYRFQGAAASSGAAKDAGATSGNASAKPADPRVAELELKVADLQAEVAKWKDSSLRYLADAENARRIAQRDVKEGKLYALKGFAKDLLEVPDTFEKATFPADVLQVKALGEHAEKLSKYAEGIRLTHDVLKKVIARHGLIIQEIKERETIFDPNVHEAITLVEDASVTDGTIVSVFKTGYMLHDRVLRAAQVVVSKGGPPQPPKPQKDAKEGADAEK